MCSVHMHHRYIISVIHQLRFSLRLNAMHVTLHAAFSFIRLQNIKFFKLKSIHYPIILLQNSEIVTITLYLRQD